MLQLGYVDVRRGLSTSSPQRKTFPLQVVVGAPPLSEPLPPTDLALLATNPIELDVPPTDLFVGAKVTRNDATGRTIEVLLAPAPALVDAEVIVRINTSFFTNDVDYVARPSPLRGEAFLVVGTRFRGTAGIPLLRAVLGVNKETSPLHPRDVTRIELAGAFHQPRELIVGQMRQRTSSATFGSGADYRRAIDGDFDGILLDLTVHDPTTGAERWIHVDVSQPRAEWGPARAVVPQDAGPGAPPPLDPGETPGEGLPTGSLRQYRVTWVHATGNETAASPPSGGVGTLHNRIRVPLPVWTDPQTPGLTGVEPAEPVTRRRVYRTVSGFPGNAGEFFLVKEVKNTTDTEFVDDRADHQLGEPLLTDLRVRYRHTVDRDGTQLAAGFATLRGTLTQSSYEEETDGTPRFRGTVYDVGLVSTPCSADVPFTTRAPVGKPRVTWSSASSAGPAGVASATVAVIPIGAGAAESSVVRATIESLPPAFGVDWLVFGGTRTRIEVGRSDDARQALPAGLGLLVLRSALVDAPLQRASSRSASIDSTPETLALTARGVRRLRLFLGLPLAADGFATLDDGVVAELELDPRRDRPRSLRLLRDAAGDDGTSRFMVRVGELPDALVVDARPGHEFAPTKVRVSGRLLRLMVLSQSAAELAAENVTGERRRDGTWVTVPDLGSTFELVFDQGVVTATPSAAIRADLSRRSMAGLGTEASRIHQIEACLTTASQVELHLPDSGATSAKVAGGASGRVALSWRGLDPALRDRLLAVRATPQVKAVLRQDDPDDDGPLTDDLTARVLGLSELSGLTALTGAPPGENVTDPFVARLTATRANKAFRGGAVLSDTRAGNEPWDLVKARIVDLPESVELTLRAGIKRYHLVLDRRSGRVVVLAQPTIVPSDGPAAGQLVGVGLVKADVDALPTDLQLDVLGGANDLQSAPFNATPDGDWVRSGFRIKADGEVIARGVQIVSVSFVRPYSISTVPLDVVEPTAFWTNTAASLIRLSPQAAAPPGALWIWTPSEPLPSSTLASAWEDLSSWLGYRIEDPALVTLQIQAYEDKTEAIPRWWNDGGFSWLLKAEFQMKDYRGEVTVDADLSPEGDDDAGPGLWYLRIPDGAPLGGQVVFGNTGGWISNRPRIFAPFPL